MRILKMQRHVHPFYPLCLFLMRDLFFSRSEWRSLLIKIDKFYNKLRSESALTRIELLNSSVMGIKVHA